MNYRTVELHASESFDADITKVIDININDPISSLVLMTRGLNASSVMTAAFVACLTKVEIVDGSDVIHSLDGYELEALDWYSNKGRFRDNYNATLNTMTFDRAIGINFGRFLWDRLYALDPTRFNNLQLKVSIDANGGGSAISAFHLAVWANIFEERVPEMRGFLMTKEIKQWTTVSAQHEYTDLPTDYPYRALYLRAFVLGTEPAAIISHIKISEDVDKRIPIDMDGSELVRTIANQYPHVEEHFYFAITNATKYIYCAATERVAAFVERWVGSVVADIEYSAYNGDGGRLDLLCTTNSNVQVMVRGSTPHGVYEIPVGLKDDPDDAFDVTRINSLRADITGGADATAHLFIQQYRNY